MHPQRCTDVSTRDTERAVTLAISQLSLLDLRGVGSYLVVVAVAVGSRSEPEIVGDEGVTQVSPA